jgi:hypothetical protein
MTIYRRRLSSSFYALRQTLEDRLAAMKSGRPPMQEEYGDDAETAMFDAEDEVLAPDEIAEFKRAALAQEEKEELPACLKKSVCFRLTPRPNGCVMS